MSLYFITGSLGKFAEAKAILPELQQLAIDLPEIQEIDPRVIIDAKLRAALAVQRGSFIVEDTSLYIHSLKGLPGPLIKWFLKTLGNKGLAKIALSAGDAQAEAATIIGYAAGTGDISFFEGRIKGTIVAPRGDSGFGWDPIFVPDGYSVSFAEMSAEEKNKISMRKIAFQKLADFLKERK